MATKLYEKLPEVFVLKTETADGEQNDQDTDSGAGCWQTPTFSLWQFK